NQRLNTASESDLARATRGGVNRSARGLPRPEAWGRAGREGTGDQARERTESFGLGLRADVGGRQRTKEGGYRLDTDTRANRASSACAAHRNLTVLRSPDS